MGLGGRKQGKGVLFELGPGGGFMPCHAEVWLVGWLVGWSVGRSAGWSGAEEEEERGGLSMVVLLCFAGGG